jgi:1-acyl-sn-glycerol-3-phosphate acyltransferase
LGLYPEGTRSPDKKSLHKLHRRILIPIFESHPEVPVHAITTTYGAKKFGRRHVFVHLSKRLPIDVSSMSAAHIVDVIKNEILEAGGMAYVDAFARDIKASNISRTES